MGADRRPAIFAFVASAALILVYALRGGGSYDLVAYEENGLFIWWILALGIALGLLPRHRPARGSLLLLGALLAYAAWTALSLTWTSSSELTMAEVARSLDYLGVTALLVSALDRSTWRHAAAGLGFGALLVCAVAVGSHLGPSVFGSDQVDAALKLDRLSVPFGYWNSVAAWGAMCTAIGLAWSAHDPVRARRAVALAFVPVAALTTYLTYSRAGVGGVALGVIAVLALSRHRLTVLIHAAVAGVGSALLVLAVRSAPQIAHGSGTSGAPTVLLVLLVAAASCGGTAALTARARMSAWRMPRRAARAVGAVATVTVLIATAVFGPTLASHAWHSFTSRPVESRAAANPTARLTTLSSARYPLWRSVLQAFEAHPLEGIGAGTTEFWWNEHGTTNEFVRDAHSIWLQNMAELGAPGLLLIVAVAAAALGAGLAVRRRARRSVSAGAAAAFLAAFLVYLLHASVDWMWESTAVTVLALGGIAILSARLSEGQPHWRIPTRAVLVLLALVAGLVQLPGLLSTAEVRRSQTAQRLGQPSLAYQWAQDAVQAEPWSATALQQRGLVLEANGRLQPAAADLTQAIANEPQNYLHWLVLARIETELGRLGPAVRDYNRARQLRPHATVFAQAIARPR